MSTRPEPQVGQTWVSDSRPMDLSSGQVITIKRVDDDGAFPISFAWPNGMTGAWERSMHGFSPTAETWEKWNQAGAAPRAELAAAKATIERLKVAARERVRGVKGSAHALVEARWFLHLIEEADAAPAVVAESTPATAKPDEAKSPDAPTDYSI